MLVLTRKKGESIMIGNNIKIIVNKVETKTVQIGIEAPKKIKIIREPK